MSRKTIVTCLTAVCALSWTGRGEVAPDPDGTDAAFTNAVASIEAAVTTNLVDVTAAATNAVASIEVAVTTNLVDVTAAATNGVEGAAAAAETAEMVKRRRIATRTFKLSHASAQELADRFNATWSGDFGLSWKISRIASAFPEANAVMVTAPGVILDACEEVIRAVDVEAPQVYIEARFVELSNSAMHKLGIDWSMLEGMKGSMGLSGGFQQRQFGKGMANYKTVTGDSQYNNTEYTIDGREGEMSYFNGTLSFSDMSLVLSALERDNDVKTFSNPRIIVSSGKKATVDMTEKYPNVTISAKRTVTSATASSLDLDMKLMEIPGEDKMMFAKEAFFSWGISLEVTPRITTNGLINVSIVPTISDCTGFVTAEVGASSKSEDDVPYSKYPIINMQRLITDFTLASGTTAVIGGLSKTTEESVDTGIPWLRDWPWIGEKLFGSKSRQKVQKEIIVFVTVGMASAKQIPADLGLPKNAVLGRTYTQGIRQEPGDQPGAFGGVSSLDLRPLEVQARDPANTNKTPEKMTLQLPFQKRR